MGKREATKQGILTAGKIAGKTIPLVGEGLILYEGVRSARRDFAQQRAVGAAAKEKIAALWKAGRRKEAANVAAHYGFKIGKVTGASGLRTVAAGFTTAEIAEKYMPRTNGRKKAGGARKARPLSVQSLLFDKRVFDLDYATAWASSHGYSDKHVEETKGYYRIRQYSPSRGTKSRYRTINFGERTGIKAVVTVKKPRKAAVRKAPARICINPRLRKVVQYGDVQVYRNAEYDEWIVKPYAGAPERQWYFTNDREDAYATAREIHLGRGR